MENKYYYSHLICSVAVSNSSIFHFYKSLSVVWNYALRATIWTTTKIGIRIVIGHGDFFRTFWITLSSENFNFIHNNKTTTIKASVCVHIFFSLYLFKNLRWNVFFCILLLLIPNFFVWNSELKHAIDKSDNYLLLFAMRCFFFVHFLLLSMSSKIYF